mmetsp:Transcript_12125/g.15869  ORF Transcript_12125/g.15869 Transcript_12125/m.15869 type:complete len:945 (+) Transcript_12125:71-2905(+)
MASRVQWRRFTFFEKDTICEDLSAEIGAVITCMKATEEGIFLGDDLGRITFADTDFQRQRRHEAYKGVVTALGLIRTADAPALVTTGDDSDGMGATNVVQCIFKVWTGPEFNYLARSIDVTVQTKCGASSMAAFAHSVDGSMVAIGFESGEILFYQGDMAKETAKVKAPIVIKPVDDKQPVTALFFCERAIPHKEGAKVVRLFTGYKELPLEDSGPPLEGQGIGTYACPVTDPPQFTLLDERGLPAGNNAAYNARAQELVVGRTDGVYFYTAEDRGGAAGFEGQKQGLACLGGYVLVASLDTRSERTAINVYDLYNKFVAFHLLLPLGQGVEKVSCSSSTAYVVTSAGAFLRLREKDTSSKLDLLFRKNLYPIAISLAYSSSYDVNAIMDIYRMYGDHLYKKCDFDAAMAQYCHTIGYLEPSYVIRRFLDAQRINNLTIYLEKLHDLGYGTADHTTLLLNCYTKLKEVEKLDRFIHPPDDKNEKKENTEMALNRADPRSRRAGPKFEVATALKVLNSAGYFDHARDLAAAHGMHDWFLRTQLERSDPDYHSALAHIASLEPPKAEEYLKKHGKTLVKNLPEETTGLLMLLCTGKQKDVSSTIQMESAQNAERSNPESFIHLYVDHPEWLLLFLEFVVKEEGGASADVGNTLLELLLGEWSKTADKAKTDLDALAQQKQREEEILSLLGNPRIDYDKNHALLLVQMVNFKPGQLKLYENLGMTEMSLAVYTESNDTRAMLRLCRREGKKNPGLWLKVLFYMVETTFKISKKKEIDDIVNDMELWNDIKELLSLIERDQILEPIEVLQVLSKYPHVPLSVIKSYIIKTVVETNQEVDEMQLETKDLKQSTNIMKLEIQSLRSHSQLVTSGITSSKLDLTTSFVLESMDQGVVIEGGKTDSERRKIEEIKRSQLQKAKDHEQFFKDLEESTNGYSQVAQYFGKGVLK